MTYTIAAPKEYYDRALAGYLKDDEYRTGQFIRYFDDKWADKFSDMVSPGRCIAQYDSSGTRRLIIIFDNEEDYLWYLLKR